MWTGEHEGGCLKYPIGQDARRKVWDLHVSPHTGNF